MKVAYEHIIPSPIDRVIAAYGSEGFYVEKQKASGAISVDILEWETLERGKIRTKARVSEPSRQPAFIRKSDVDTFVDDGVLDPEGGTLNWKITPAAGADKFFLKGCIEFHAQGDSTRVVYRTDLKVKIPLLGSKVEKFALDKVEGETAAQASFLKEWLARE